MKLVGPRTCGTDLQPIYQVVLNRKYSSQPGSDRRLLAITAAGAAARFVERPCQETLDAFRAAERNWQAYGRGSDISCADRFEAALESGRWHRRATGVNSAWSTDWQISIGYVYGASSTDRPGWIKLGATSQHPTDRLAQFAKHYGLCEMRPEFFMEISQPKLVEAAWHQQLRESRVGLSRSDSREWFRVDPSTALDIARAVVERNSLRCWSRTYVNPRMSMAPKKGATDFCPTGYVYYGGRRALAVS